MVTFYDLVKCCDWLIISRSFFIGYDLLTTQMHFKLQFQAYGDNVGIHLFQ